ncbi:hypothetical protein BDZ85DRAFT_56441 [Elsinoe ampelina]|uniref:18S rRNA factor 2 n=1 Tax=Elsinoe ampelina TaxID=302913 RepID=A0A6A6GNP1_9PEZI|nr:hypothetical protein BDZ85DRAFT_56441 [Elsinoe ampelina]
MPSRKRNEWLEPDEEDELSNDSDLEGGAEQSKVHLTSRSIKRRRLDDGSDSGNEDFSDDDELDKASGAILKQPHRRQSTSLVQDSRFSRFPTDDIDSAQEDALDGHRDGPEKEEDPTRNSIADPSASTADSATKKGKAKKKSGVIYISRIPPFMKPATVRNYLEPYGKIGKLFLTPEDHAAYSRRVKSGGNKKHSYVDGWVEFLSKKDAKMVASVLNGNSIGGKKGNYYYDDIWNIKYLTGFKWDDLTEQIQRENKEREARLRTEITKAKKENETFVRDIERGKMVEGIKSKRKDVDGDATLRSDDSGLQLPRKFKQNLTKRKQKDELPSDPRAGNVLSKII